MQLDLVNESHALLKRAKEVWEKYSKGKISVEGTKISTSLLHATKGTINTAIKAEQWYTAKGKKTIKKK